MFQYIQKYKIKSCLGKNKGENIKKRRGKQKKYISFFIWKVKRLNKPTHFVGLTEAFIFIYIYKLLITRVVNKPISYQKGISKNKKSKNYRSNYYR